MGSSTLESAHSKLDSLGQPSARLLDGADEAAGRTEDEHKVSWQLAKTDYGSVFVKADEKERITYITAYLWPGKETFEKIGQLGKAPVLTDRVVAWDVVRPNRPLYSDCRTWVKAESELHHDVHRETTARRLAGVGSERKDACSLADLPTCPSFSSPMETFQYTHFFRSSLCISSLGHAVSGLW